VLAAVVLVVGIKVQQVLVVEVGDGETRLTLYLRQLLILVVVVEDLQMVSVQIHLEHQDLSSLLTPRHKYLKNHNGT
jgi:16S rRNA A1518/A1519 N6-dimethyltransferase RsmA/KsgA/DIM1 with predicted DNA glycosylase/AP lyase activity